MTKLIYKKPQIVVSLSKILLRILFLLLIFGRCEAQTPTPSLSMCLRQPGDLSNLVGWKTYLDGVELFRTNLSDATQTSVPGNDCISAPCYCFPLPWFITNPDQQQLFVSACAGNFDQSCSLLSNEWPTRTPTFTATITRTPVPFITQTPLPTNTLLPTNTPLNTQTPLPTNTLAPTLTATITPTITPTFVSTPNAPVIICKGENCLQLLP